MDVAVTRPYPKHSFIHSLCISLLGHRFEAHLCGSSVLSWNRFLYIPNDVLNRCCQLWCLIYYINGVFRLCVLWGPESYKSFAFVALNKKIQLATVSGVSFRPAQYYPCGLGRK